jgi:hypothetical protein
MSTKQDTTRALFHAILPEAGRYHNYLINCLNTCAELVDAIHCVFSDRTVEVLNAHATFHNHQSSSRLQQTRQLEEKLRMTISVPRPSQSIEEVSKRDSTAKRFESFTFSSPMPVPVPSIKHSNKRMIHEVSRLREDERTEFGNFHKKRKRKFLEGRLMVSEFQNGVLKRTGLILQRSDNLKRTRHKFTNIVKPPVPTRRQQNSIITFSHQTPSRVKKRSTILGSFCFAPESHTPPAHCDDPGGELGKKTTRICHQTNKFMNRTKKKITEKC